MSQNRSGRKQARMSWHPAIVHGTELFIHHQAGPIDRMALRVEQIMVMPLRPFCRLVNRQIEEVLPDGRAFSVQALAQKAPGR